MDNLMLLLKLICLYCIFVKVNSLDFLKKYDDVIYDSKLVHESHKRVSRSLDPHVNINFNSYGRNFNLKLKPAKSLFEHDYIEIDGDKKYPTNNYLFYEGNLIDEPNSYASGSIIDGVFYGTIKTKNGNYHIESSKRYNGEFKSHSIIYHDDDVVFNKTSKNKRDASHHNDHIGCASEDVLDWMSKVQKETYEEHIKTGDFERYYTYVDHQIDVNKYSKEVNEKLKRQKREAERIPFPNGKSVCNLYIKIDPILYEEIFNKEGSKIITFDACQDGSLSSVDAKLCEKYLDVQTYLSYVSKDNYDKFCLAYSFTARDFADGTLGLAWVAKPSGSIGGVCERNVENNNERKSLNAGIVTLINYASRVPDLVSQVTFAHEVGHNFGSEHDPENALCAPSDSSGKFIMYPRATTGKEKNNREFSECSKTSMGKVMFSLTSNKEKFCFEDNTGPLCGNMILEEGEQCDCGFAEECKENCCYSADSSEILRCTLKPNVTCSPSQGSCCDSETCDYASTSKICYEKSDCLTDVYCSGDAAYCPKNDSTYFINESEDGSIKECNKGSQVCRDGVCTGSICEKYNMTQCYLEGELSNKKTDKERLCHLACTGEKTDNKCVDTFELKEIFNGEGFILKPGSLCAGTQGYCDILSKCRAVDAEGPLTRLRNVFLDPKTLTTVKEWITTYWWAVVLIGIGVIIFMGLFIRVCSVRTPSSNPGLPPPRPIRESFRRRPPRQGKVSPSNYRNSKF